MKNKIIEYLQELRKMFVGNIQESLEIETPKDGGMTLLEILFFILWEGAMELSVTNTITLFLSPKEEKQL